MLVDDFSLEREVLSLNAENRRLEKRTLRAEMALNAIKRRLGEYVVQPSTDTKFADPNLQGVMPGAPWANDLLDAVGARVDGTANGGDANPTAVNAVSNRGGDSKDAWSRATRRGRTRSRSPPRKRRAMVVSAPRSERHDVFIGISRAKKTDRTLAFAATYSISHHHQSTNLQLPTHLYLLCQL